MAKEYIEREAFRKALLIGAEYLDEDTMLTTINVLDCAPAADVVEVETVAQMFCDCFGNPCDYSPTDEWLPEICELQGECPNTKDPLGCWKQFIKHY